jgi:methylenetetrahydrofolate dehydrogenase (NADP+)/methenyltetrahydrofolate cyclohydrolase
MTKIFDGKKAANDLRASLKEEVLKLSAKPKLVSILVGEAGSGKKYLSLKKVAAEEMGTKLEIIDFGEDAKTKEIIELTEDLNAKDDVHGIMLQLPLPKEFSEKEKEEIVSCIAKKKDVDGMKDDSAFIAPVVKAVLFAIRMAGELKTYEEGTLFVVLGAEGFVGEKIFKALEDMGLRVKGVDLNTKSKNRMIKDADVLISATGKSGVVQEGMVKDGAILIDVGAPDAEIEEKAKNKALFATPVPGGIGPLTIGFLLENLVEAAKEQS